MSLIGYKVRLELNVSQRNHAEQHCGVARHAWNWGVNYCREAYQRKDKHPSAIDLHKLLVRDVKSELKWYYDVSKNSPQESLRDLEKSYNKFFKDFNNGTYETKRKKFISNLLGKGKDLNDPKIKDKIFHFGKPQFKKKGRNDGFYLEGAIKISGNKIKLPKMGEVKLSESFHDITVKNVRITKRAGMWFLSFKADYGTNARLKERNPLPMMQDAVIGVDLGIKTLATLSDGTTYANPKAFKRYKRRLKIAQRKQSKKFVVGKSAKEQSNNYKKAAAKVAKIHYRISCIRSDNTHKLTSDLAKNHSVVVIEDLNVSGMIKNRKLSSAITDGGFYEFRRQLTYKTALYGSKLVVADRFFPSSKTCSCCGKKKEKLSLSERTFNCECGFSLDRDLNAAINLREYAFR
jgi:putative transposase